MKTRMILGMALPIVGMAMLSGCATSPVCEYVATDCPAPVGECTVPACPRLVVHRNFYVPHAGFQGQFLTAGGAWYPPPAMRVRPYYRPYSVLPVGERVYFPRTTIGPRIYNASTQNWERCAPFGPNSATSPSRWW